MEVDIRSSCEDSGGSRIGWDMCMEEGKAEDCQQNDVERMPPDNEPSLEVVTVESVEVRMYSWL
jgi:hypothetical protein